MWHRAFVGGGGAALPWRSLARRSVSNGASGAVDSIILRSLKEHYLEVSKMTPPPKVNPPSPYTIVKGALDKDGPVLRRSYKDEEITISVMRLANIMPAGAEGDDGDDSINQLFLHVDVSKPGRKESLHFLCGLYPDAVGIHSVCLRPKVAASGSASLSKYQGRAFQ
ncbi:putative Mitochondrial glycoprotein [Cocos nucifera]|nr:putative Mitochondrial glycoprotein [Cocos nucifera]